MSVPYAGDPGCRTDVDVEKTIDPFVFRSSGSAKRVRRIAEPDRRRLLLESVASGGISGYGIDDHAALLWTARTVAGAFSARRGATVYRVERGADQVVEIPLAPSVVVPQAGDPAVPPEIAEFRRLRQAAYK